MQPRHLSIGVIIAICLIVYWWMKDHPRTQPVNTGHVECSQCVVAI